MNTNIAIVGGGASCISFLDAILKRKNQSNINNLSLVVIEKSKELGPGNAYFSDVKTNLLNTKAGYITVFRDKPSDFYNWLHSNENKWKSVFSDLKINKNSYLPRALFGMYMKDSFLYICEQVRRAGVKITILNDEAINIEQAENEKVNIYTKNGILIKSDRTVLACGTQQLSDMFPPYSSDIIHNPYPTLDLNEKISHDQNIAIIGARLSAIDATIGLIEHGHTGSITIFSRSGFFPYVRGIQDRYKNAFLTKEYIDSHNLKLNFYELNKLFRKECERYKSLSGDEYFEDLPSLFNKPIENLDEFLAGEIELSKRNRGWQAILYDTNSSIDDIWGRIGSEEQNIFMQKYMSYAMSLRVSIPPENAEKILRYLRNGQLKFVAGAPSVEVDDGKLTVRCNDMSTLVHKIIYATGSPKLVDKMDSILIHNLIDSGMGNQHKFGGLNICKNTYRLLDKDGKENPNIFVVGELTSGCFLFISALDIVARHAYSCADQVAKSLIESQNLLSLV